MSHEQLALAQVDVTSHAREGLVEALIRRKLLSQADADVIEAVVQRQLNRQSDLDFDPDSDPTSDPTSKSKWEGDNPHATRAALPESTVAGDRSAKIESAGEELFATIAAGPHANIGEFGRFSVLRPHAKGGLGQVLIAKDLQLNREIALKEILPAYADDPVSRQRFLREAEITGALEHPGIVPVYSLGAYPDGRPFYAMRFVLGRDMQAAIHDLHSKPPGRRSGSFELRQLLGRLVDVCHAVDYAHNRGIVHRDIKPENIMLGDYGETLVVDWGLARPAGEAPPEQKRASGGPRLVTPSPQSTPSHTRDGQIVGTPLYMSPEQAAGRLDLLGPASDIYSLGATLYHLITGQPPFAGASRNVIGSVQRGQFAPPRKIDRHVARPLEAICLCAMATDPADRYATARELGLDIERYLADEKATAYREPIWARAWRWIRHHRTAVMSMMAAATVALAALSVGVVLLGAANQRERAAKEEATRNFDESVKQRDRAEQNFALAQQAVRNYYVEVSEETLLSQPGMQPLRNALLRQALDYYDQFLQQRSDDPALQSELAQAAFYVGRITETIASPELALPYYEQSISRYERLAEEQGSDSQEGSSPAYDQQQSEYARVLNAAGGAQQKIRGLDAARKFYEQARAIRQRLAAKAPEDFEAARELSNTLMNLGSLSLREGDPDEAIRQMQHAQTIRLAHQADAQGAVSLRRDLAMGYFNLAAAQLVDADADGAQRNLLEAVTAFADLVDAEPLSIDHQRRLAITHRLLGDLFGRQGRGADAMEYYNQAKAALQTLVGRNPSVPDFKVDLAGVLMNLGAQQAQEGEPTPALAHLQQASTLLADLADEPESPPRYRRDLAAARRAAGQILTSLDRRDEATQELNASREILEGLVRSFPDDSDFSTQLQETLAAVAALEEDSPEP